MTSETVVEVALNGPWGRALQPGMPILPEEIVREGIECARRGASIVHLHAYDPETGRQNDDSDTYRRIIEAIRREVDAIIYPTIPLAGSSLTGAGASPAERFGHVEHLGRHGLLEMTVVDPGSVNFTRIPAGAPPQPGFVYVNPEDHVLCGLEISERFGIRPSYAIYEPGFTRLGASLAARFGRLRTPLYRLMFSDDFAWGFPPEPYALEAHLRLLSQNAPDAAWMIAGLGVDLRNLAAPAIERGGHLRIGLEDARLGTERSNADLVGEAVAWVRDAGSEPASAERARAILAASDESDGKARDTNLSPGG